MTDADAKTATDTVRLVVARTEPTTLLNETKLDTTPNFYLSSTVEFPFTVPAGTGSLDVTLSWTTAYQYYDLHVVDPSS